MLTLPLVAVAAYIVEVVPNMPYLVAEAAKTSTVPQEQPEDEILALALQQEQSRFGEPSAVVARQAAGQQ